MLDVLLTPAAAECFTTSKVVASPRRRVFIDVGSADFADTSAFLRHYRGAATFDVHCFEPADAYHALSAAFTALHPMVTVHAKAVGVEATPAEVSLAEFLVAKLGVTTGDRVVLRLNAKRRNMELLRHLLRSGAVARVSEVLLVAGDADAAALQNLILVLHDIVGVTVVDWTDAARADATGASFLKVHSGFLPA
jgi:hypothetical protein